MKQAFAGLMLLALSGCGTGWPIASVKQLDVARYMGHWYEIARYPHFFQVGCSHSQADYSLRADGQTVDIVNSCWRNGSWDAVRGFAHVADPREPGHLSVTLKVPVIGKVSADYHVLALADDYSWALVGHPTRSYLWILSRTPALDPSVITALASQAERQFEYAGARGQLRCIEQQNGDVASCRAALAAVSKNQQHAF